MLTTSPKLKYSYKTVPFAHQKRALAKIHKLNGVAGLFMEMGTGKTKVAIDWAGIGYYNSNIRRVLVVAPLSVLSVWPRQIREHGVPPSRIHRLTGSTAHRVAVLQRILRRPKDENLVWILINYEGIWREPDRGPGIETLLKRWKPDLIIFDESHRLKSNSSKQSRTAARIAKEVPQRLLLTGTPITKAPLDLFGQFRALDPIILGDNWYRFKFTYGIWGGYGNYQLRGYRNLRELVDKVRASSFRIKKEQCLDLPEKLYVDVPVTLSDRAVQVYREMAEQMIAEIEETHATASIVLVKMLRLSQITSGFVKDVDKNIRIFDEAKLNTAMDLLSDALEEGHKVVIFVRFRTDFERLAERLTDAKIRYRILSGSVPLAQRDSFVQEFHEDPKLQVFVAQIQAGSLGIDLTPADVAIFYSLDYNAANYWQAQDRLHRIGQTRKVTYYHLVVPRSIDTVVLRTLKFKGNVAEAVIHKPRELLGF